MIMLMSSPSSPVRKKSSLFPLHSLSPGVPWVKVKRFHRCALDIVAHIGYCEAPLYDEATNTLHFVDIVEKQVYHFQLDDRSLDKVTCVDAVTCLSLRRNGEGLACATARGFAILRGRYLDYVAMPLSEEERLFTRFNDGACDIQGRFFVGTIESKTHNVDIAGKLYCYDPFNNSCKVVDDGPFTDSNGLGWSPDGTILYFTDSLRNQILAYDYDASTGGISNKRVFVDCLQLGLPNNTFPDGLCIDSEGGVWSARWGGGKVVRFNPQGQLDAEIVFTTALNITACCFGGPNDDQMFVTSTHCGVFEEDASRQEKYPDSGDVFVIDLSGKYKGCKWRHAFAG